MRTTIDATDLTNRLEQGEIPQFWNVLTDEYFTGEMIPGSRRVPLDRVGRESSGLSKDTELVVYCSGPACPQSGAAADKLRTLGFTNVREFAGGLQEWKEAGGTVKPVAEAA